MKYLTLIITVAFLVSCSDDPCLLELQLPVDFNNNVYQSNISTINQYLDANELEAEMTSSGLYYIIEEGGSEDRPELCDQVSVAYSGYLPDGTVFDASQGVEFPLSNVILGWQEGIPLFGKGGRGTLLIPSYLAYGNNSPSPLIPNNSVLIFDVELLDF